MLQQTHADQIAPAIPRRSNHVGGRHHVCPKSATNRTRTSATKPLSAVATAIADLKAGTYDEPDLTNIARAKAVAATPYLKKEFETAKTDELKLGIASALVRLGDRTPAYWDYLESAAAEATESDLPYPAGFNQNGDFVPASHLISPRGSKAITRR